MERSESSEVRIRQVGVVTRDPAPLETAVQAVFGLALSDRFPGIDQFGLGTAFFPLGNQFLEIVHAAVPGTSADRLIERRGGDTGFVVMVESGPLAPITARAESGGLRIVDRGSGERGDWIQIHPRDMGGTLVAVHHMRGEGAGDDDGPWLYGGERWREARRTNRVSAVSTVHWECADPARTARCWAEMLDATVHASDDCSLWTLALRGGSIEFGRGADISDPRGEPGMVGLTVECTDIAAVSGAASRLGLLDADGNVQLGGLNIRLALSPR